MLENDIIDILTKKALNLWPSEFQKYENEFKMAALSVCLRCIKELRLFEKKGDAATYDEMIKKHRISKHGEYILDKILFILVEDKVLVKDDNYYILDKIPDIGGYAEIMVSLARRFPEEGASIQWLARASDGLVAVLKGEAYAEDVLFPWSSFELVEDLYANSRIYGFYSELGAYAINLILQTCFNGSATLMEIGAGTGNSSKPVIDECIDKIEKYYFTDISKTLIKRSKQKFISEKIEFKILDITGSLEDQGYSGELVDIIYAVNVYHAAHDLRKAIENSMKLLKKGGAIVLAEISPPKGTIYRFMELTFGLLESYSGYSDKEMRPVSPIIRPDEWVSVLNKFGFVDCVTVPYGKAEIDDRGGVVIGFKR